MLQVSRDSLGDSEEMPKGFSEELEESEKEQESMRFPEDTRES